MPRTQRVVKPLATIWSASDDLWARVEPILLEDAPPRPTGRPRCDLRRALDGVIHRLRSGCQWNQLPREFGSDRTIHRWFQRWCRNGVFERIWAALLAGCDELGGVDWTWQSADGQMGKARFGGEKGGQEPHRPRQERHQEEPDRRGRRRAAGGGDRRGQRARRPVAG